MIFTDDRGVRIAWWPARVAGFTAEEWRERWHVFSPVLGLGSCGFCQSTPAYSRSCCRDRAELERAKSRDDG